MKTNYSFALTIVGACLVKDLYNVFDVYSISFKNMLSFFFSI